MFGVGGYCAEGGEIFVFRDDISQFVNEFG